MAGDPARCTGGWRAHAAAVRGVCGGRAGLAAGLAPGRAVRTAATDARVKALVLDLDSFVGGGQVGFNRTWGLVGEVEVIEDTTRYSLGVRASF